MKRWQQWVIYIIFQMAGVYFMALSLGHWHEFGSETEITRIICCVLCYTVSLSMYYRYDLRPFQSKDSD
jgi:hypothetical protein